MATEAAIGSIVSRLQETKTARRKREREERKRNGGHVPAGPSPAQVEAMKARLLTRLCSDYWANEVINGRHSYPQTGCTCKQCQGQRRFPSIHFGSREISYDCFLELTEARPEPIRKMTDGDAMNEGLTLCRRKEYGPRPPIVLVAGCERCEEGMKPRGERYCMKCADLVRREMKDSGYLK